MRKLAITIVLIAAHPAAVQAQSAAEAAPGAGVSDTPAPPMPSRAVTLALPLFYNGALLGDVLAEVSTDEVVRYNRQSLVQRLESALTDAGAARLAELLPAADFVSEAELQNAGVALRYDAARLEIQVERIDSSMERARSLGDTSRFSDPPITMTPETFSAYLNVIGDLRVSDFREFDEPAAILQGAVRYRGVVLEVDGGYDRVITQNGSGFYRRQARLVYDEPERQRRWTAGDLQVLGLPIGAGTLLGGVALEKGRRIFSGATPVIDLGGQQMLINRDATVEVVIDGQVAERFQLNSGTYDLSELLAQYGGRDAQLFVTDVSGRRQITSFDPFYDPSDLVAGETEYGAALGFVPTSFQAQPEYSDNPGFSGYYRRGITNRLLVGGALQVSEDIQMIAAEVAASPAALPLRFELSGALSNGDGTGFAVRAASSFRSGYGPTTRQFSVSVDYRSRNFATLSDLIGLGRFETLSVTANYSQSLGPRMLLIVGGSWFERERSTNTRLVFADVLYRAPRFRISAGAEYGDDLYGRRVGGRITLTVPLGQRTRAEAAYNSRRDDARIGLTRSYDDTIGSFGYDITALHSEDFEAIEGSATYIGNRFYSRLTSSTSGNSFSKIDDQQETRLQIGTSLAFAGGSVALGRPVNDAFLIATTHPSLGEKQVVVGNSLDDGAAEAESGILGPGLTGRLGSYNRQSVMYDIKGGTEGYDIGTGIQTINPPYKSGYRLVVGSDANVSAYGYLNIDGERANLVAGIVEGVDDEDFEAQPFFTNSVGRFAVQGLRPGKIYEVRLSNPAADFTIQVPSDTKPLLQMGDVHVTGPAQEEE